MKHRIMGFLVTLVFVPMFATAQQATELYFGSYVGQSNDGADIVLTLSEANDCGSSDYVAPAADGTRLRAEEALARVADKLDLATVTVRTDGCSGNRAVIVGITAGIFD